MKKFALIVIALTCSIYSYGQTEDGLSKKILLEFKEEVKPHLKNFAQIGISEANNQDKELIRAKYNMYLAKIVVIEKKVDEAISKSSKYSTDKLYILKIVENQYRNTFVGLSQEFWDSVEQRVAKL